MKQTEKNIQSESEGSESPVKGSFSQHYLLKSASMIGFDARILSLMETDDIRVHGYLAMLTFVGVFCHAFGLSCFIDLMLSGYILNQGILWFFVFVFFNIYRLVYSVGGRAVAKELSSNSKWYPSMGFNVFVIVVSLLACVSFGVYEALYLFGWEEGHIKVDRLFSFEWMQHPVFMTLGFLFLFISSVSSLFYRYRHIDVFRRYYDKSHGIHRGIIEAEWRQVKKKSEEILEPYAAYRTRILPMFKDPPFNTEYLIMGLLDPKRVESPKEDVSNTNEEPSDGSEGVLED